MSQIMFGSDFPYRPLGKFADSLTQSGFTDAQLLAMGRDIARTLLPNLGHGD